MIKFFRHIRQNMIDQNKTKKYLLYATGEIILVVIGILIALSINNWNENLKKNKKEAYFIDELQKEFINDSLTLQSLIFLSNIKAEEGKIVKEFLLGQSISKDSIISMVFFNGRFLEFESFTPTYDEIIATGQQSIIKNDSLKTLIKAFKDQNSFYKRFLYDECMTIKQQYNLHAYKYFERSILPELWKNATKENKFVDIDALGDYITDVEGYKNDPQSLYYVTMNMGVDLDLNRFYKTVVMPDLELILKKIRDIKSKS